MDLLVRRRRVGGRPAQWVLVVLAVSGVAGAARARKRRARRGPASPPPRGDSGGGPPARPSHASGDPSVLQVLNGDLLRQRTAEGHARGYVNLVGMLQSVALAWMLLILHQPAIGSAGPRHNILIFAQAIIEVAAIIIIYHQYRVLTVLLCWVENIFDTIIPFIIFAAEIWLGTNIGRGASWWLALAVLCLASGMALLHTFGRTARGMFGVNETGYRRYRKALKAQAVLAAAMAAEAGAMAMALSWWTPPAFLRVAAMLLIFAAGISLALHSERDQNVLFAEYEMRRGGWSFRASTTHGRS
jgi:hypothetical protein